MSDSDFCLDCMEVNRDRETKDQLCIKHEVALKSKNKSKKQKGPELHPEVAPSHTLLRKEMLGPNGYVKE